MWQYISTDELYHHGVPGMRWGNRKVRNFISSIRPTPKPKPAVQVIDSRKTKYYKKKLQKRNNEMSEVAREREQIRVKLIKSQYADEYNTGKNHVTKFLSKISGADKAYANTLYDLTKKYPQIKLQ